jgi:ribonuclease P protein component
MLPRRHRLRRHRDVVRATRARASAHGSFFTVRSYGRGDDAPTRFAFVVSRKVSKNATQRNRIARQARSIVAEALPNMVLGHDVVLIARSPFPPYDRTTATEELKHLFQRLHLSSS